MVHVLERSEEEGPRGAAFVARLGLVVPRAVGTAVERNRLKRQIRAAWRALRPRVAPVDCVVVVRRSDAARAFGELSDNIERCLRGLRVLTDQPAAAGAV